MQGSFLEPVHKERYSYQPYDAKLISLIDDDKDRTVSQNAETESKIVRYILLLSYDSRNDGWVEEASLKKRSPFSYRNTTPLYMRMRPKEGGSLGPHLLPYI